MSEPTAEHARLKEITHINQAWRKWGCYLAERAWGTVREDYSEDGNAWEYLSHDAARSRTYRWGEDGIAGICDRYELLCFSLAFWNYRDPILKERLFGLTPLEGNHGEDVKEYYFYLDNLPTHSYMKYLYKYPHAEYPYRPLIEENRNRNGGGEEFELLDTGVFDEDRYFDIFIEYAKLDEEDMCIAITLHNRGPEKASVQVIPQLWFRNTWGWGTDRGPEPIIEPGPHSNTFVSLKADDTPSEPLPNLPFLYRLKPRYLYAQGSPERLFTNNETNNERLLGQPNVTPYVKDAFHRCVVDGEECTNPDEHGTKACLQYKLEIAPGSSETTPSVAAPWPPP